MENFYFLSTIVILFQCGYGFFNVIDAIGNAKKKLLEEILANKKSQTEYDQVKEAFECMTVKNLELEMRGNTAIEERDTLNNKCKDLNESLNNMQVEKFKMGSIVTDQESRIERLMKDNKTFSDKIIELNNANAVDNSVIVAKKRNFFSKTK